MRTTTTKVNVSMAVDPASVNIHLAEEDEVWLSHEKTAGSEYPVLHVGAATVYLSTGHLRNLVRAGEDASRQVFGGREEVSEVKL